MRVISRKRLRDFMVRYTDAGSSLDGWYALMRHQDFDSPHQVSAAFPGASFLGRGRTVFNIGGNKYRLVVDMRYDLGRVYVREVMTHADYDRRTAAGTL